MRFSLVHDWAEMNGLDVDGRKVTDDGDLVAKFSRDLWNFYRDGEVVCRGYPVGGKGNTRETWLLVQDNSEVVNVYYNDGVEIR